MTLALPILRPIPTVQALPLPHPQSAWTQVSTDAGGGWRLTATRSVQDTPPGTRPGWGAAPTPASPYMLHLDAQGLTRLSVLETYPVADEVMVGGERFWAMWEPQNGLKKPGVAGMLTLTTPAGTQMISTTSALHGMWWSPGGHVLLAALPHDQGLDLALLDPQHPQVIPVPLITVSGAVASVHWQSEGRAVVVITTLDAPRDLSPQGAARPMPTQLSQGQTDATAPASNAVLIQLPHGATAAQATRLRAPPIRPAGMIPLAWGSDTLWWVADTGLGLALDRINLITGMSEHIGMLPDDLAALAVIDTGAIRIVRESHDGTLQVERWPDAQPLFTLPGIHATGVTGGAWRGTDLLLATSPTALWYVQIQPEALQ